MTTLLDSPYRIRDDEPSRFDGQMELVLQLQYRIDRDGNYEFSSRSATKSAGEADGSFGRRLERTRWSPFLARKEFIRTLDIGISDVDTLVQVETFGPHLFWSLATDAITTLDDMSDLYGELRYFDGSKWVKREDFDKHLCRCIRFKAKFNAAASNGKVHKFSYNVLLRDCFGDIVEYEIDPDIKNPST